MEPAALIREYLLLGLRFDRVEPGYVYAFIGDPMLCRAVRTSRCPTPASWSATTTSAIPGHHTEHCRKEARLVKRQGQIEHTIFLVNTPQCLMAEGLADLALHVAVGPRWGRWAAAIYADLGLRFDGERAEAMAEASAALMSVRQDAALMLHDERREADEVTDYVRRWLLLPENRARQMLRFLCSPLWRAYTSTYVEGDRLLRAWLDGRPPGVSLPERFCRLLDEPLIPSSLRAE